MEKKLIWLYRISLAVAIVLILFTIFVKVFVWTTALKKDSEMNDEHRRTVIRINPYKDMYNFRRTTEFRAKLFKNVEYLIRPAMMILFVILTVRLIKAPDIFEHKE